MISVDGAIQILSENSIQPKLEMIDLAKAQGRVLAATIEASVSRPPAAVSAMDGYAVRLADVHESKTQLKLIGEAPAGAPFTGVVGLREAVRIFTGGELPHGTDHIVIQEEATRSGDNVMVQKAHYESQYIRPAGMDFRKGAKILQAGTRFGATELALAAAANHGVVPVWRRLRVGILANGNEVRPPGAELAPGEIVNANTVALAALVRGWGGEPIDMGIARDSIQSVRDLLHSSERIDIFLAVGGASVGDHDLMRPAFADEGFENIFEKVAMRPGKPTWFSTRAGQRVLGLPGNPASALVCSHLFLQPLLTGCPAPFTKGRLSANLPENGVREHFMRASAYITSDGVLSVEAMTNQDSSLIATFTRSRLLIRRKSGAASAPTGQIVDVLPLGPLL